MPYSYFVNSFSVSIRLDIESGMNFRNMLLNHKFWEEYIPGFSKSNVISTHNIVWKIIESDSLELDFKNKTFRASIDSIKDIIVVIEADFEVFRQMKSIYTFHGAAVGKNGHAVGFIGNVSGLGKSTMGAYCSKRSWEWIADEKFSIQDGLIIGSTKGVLKDTKTMEATNGLKPKSIFKPYLLKILYIPIVTKESVATKHVYDCSKKLWLINDELSRDIRQVNGAIDSVQSSLQSNDNNIITKKRYKNVKNLAFSLECIFIRGDEEIILSEINREFNILN